MKETKDIGTVAANFIKQHSHILLVIGGLAMVIVLISGSLSSCSMLFGGTGNAVIGTSYTAEDEDIRGADEDYSAMEEALRERIREIEEDNPDYDEYDIDMSEIGHNPYVLAAFLTVLYEDYSRAEVQRTLRELFAAQYEYSTSHHTETVTETRQVRVGESLGQVVRDLVRRTDSQRRISDSEPHDCRGCLQSLCPHGNKGCDERRGVYSGGYRQL